MTLIVETGRGIDDADSYQTLADGRDLAAKYGIKLPTDDTEAEVLFRQGYLNINIQEPSLQGSRTHDNQTGAFPRTGVYKNCVLVGNDVITQDVKLAQLYAASAIAGGYGQNTVNNGQNLKSFNVDGVYSETYQDGSSQSTNAIIQGVVNSLYPLTKAGFAASPCGGGSGGLHRENMFPCGSGYKVI